MNLASEIQVFLKGDILNSDIEQYSRDASIFEVTPQLVVAPRDAADISHLVSFVNSKKAEDPTLSLTARAAGTCMSGGPLTTSILMDVTRYMNHIGEVEGNTLTVQPGAFYRDIERKTKEKGLILPSYTASKDLCTIGGMVANNSGGEKSLIYGSTEKYVDSLRAVMSDGIEYEFKKLTRTELEEKKALNSFEGEFYRTFSALIEENHTVIENARPQVSKNSAGYLLWNVWDPADDTFDITRVISGSQGTLGIITSITLRLVEEHTHTALLVLTLPDLAQLPEVVNRVLAHTPECFESYDDNTFLLAEKYMPDVAARVMTTRNTPITLIAQFAADTESAAIQKARAAESELKSIGVNARTSESLEESQSYWSIRRASFKLLREHTGNDHRVAPFIDDFIVPPASLPEFIPLLREILARYAFTYTLAGHIGNGNFHLIPLVDMESLESREKIIPLSEEVFSLVFKFKGSMAGEHNDGIIRTPFLTTMYGEEIVSLFKKTKTIFDPQTIFNPGKKVDGTLAYAIAHFAQTNGSQHL